MPKKKVFLIVSAAVCVVCIGLWVASFFRNVAIWIGPTKWGHENVFVGMEPGVLIIGNRGFPSMIAVNFVDHQSDYLFVMSSSVRITEIRSPGPFFFLCVSGVYSEGRSPFRSGSWHW